jgi:hypothetical protein
VRGALRDALPGSRPSSAPAASSSASSTSAPPRPSTSRCWATTSERAAPTPAAPGAARGPGPTAPRCSPTSRWGARRTTPSSTSTSTARRPAPSGITEQRVAQTVLVSLVGSSASPRCPSPTRDGQRLQHQRAPRRRPPDEVERPRAPSSSAPRAARRPARLGGRVERRAGPVQITRKYMQRVVDVTANVAPGADLGAAADAVDARPRGTPPPDGFTVRLGGQSLAQREAFSGLGFAGLLAAGPGVHGARVAVPLARRPAGHHVQRAPRRLRRPPALYLTGTTLSVNSFMGVIMMVGIAVSNGVLLVDFANVLRRAAPRSSRPPSRPAARASAPSS